MEEGLIGLNNDVSSDIVPKKSFFSKQKKLIILGSILTVAVVVLIIIVVSVTRPKDSAPDNKNGDEDDIGERIQFVIDLAKFKPLF